MKNLFNFSFKTTKTQPMFRDGLSIEDIAKANQIAESAYHKGLIDRTAYVKSQLQGEREINIRKMAIQSVKVGSYVSAEQFITDHKYF